MSRTNKGSRDVFVFLIATLCLIAVALGGLVWNAGRVRENHSQETQTPSIDDSDIQSTGKLALQFPGHGSQNIVNATMMPGDSKLRWWWPTGSEFLYLLNLRGDEVAVDRVSVLTGEGTRVAEMKQRWYDDAFGTEDRIYLLRTDTRGRYQMIADIYSISENRMVATRPLLNLPLHFGSRPTKAVWHPNGSSLAFTVAQSSRDNVLSFRTYVIDLQTGLPIEMPDSEPFLVDHRALAFNHDGSRLFLIRNSRAASPEAEKKERSIVVLDTLSSEIQSIAIPALPRILPLAISDDAERVAFAFPSRVEIWNTRTGEKTATLPTRTDGGSPWRVLKVEFFAGRDLVAVADERTLSVYATEMGARVSRFPDVPPDDQESIQPIFLGRDNGQIVVVGTSLDSVESSYFPSLWMHRTTFKEHGTSEKNAPATVVEVPDATVRSQAEWTPWRSSSNYDAEFKRQVADGKYPLTVVGRNEGGESQFRGQFIDLPENLTFFARHNTTEESPRLPKFRNRRGQLRSSDNRVLGIQRHAYREIWRQWFVDEQGTTRYNIVWTKRLDMESE
ncbi:WD40 repeat domain-containing protein [Aporhodopirellula aestuarii]|uniref:Dipeptidylpeptidase IV N-terminal domain-containing protein n=1 Tax=Aporhodopirellula aestuarii TaxID=2950107 RepID=A0ABT0U6B7_9BACT|nr:hypothetical protein [Aporhodopirellula aestuarii]MCM2372347.1 hypothetical protein [Aporhodopirellula aestuarii]